MKWGATTGLFLLLASASAVLAQSAAIPLWPAGAPGPTAPSTPESVRVSAEGDHVVTGVRQPSITPCLPAVGKPPSAAVVIAPGGGHREIWIDHEGYRVCQFLSEHGVAAFVLKYRLAQEPGAPYSLEGDSLGDIQRAIRLVRARAPEWNVDPLRVGVIGFSAGGELAALAGWRDVVPSGRTDDPVDRQNSRPAFMGLIYPSIPGSLTITASEPPAFLLAGEQDRPQVSEGLADLYLAIKRAGGSAELHILAGVPHGFGIRTTNAPQVAVWPTLFYDWLLAKGFVK